MQEYIKKLSEIAQSFNCRNEIEQLNHLLDISEERKYFLTVMGQFSAGKSRLINNLLDKDILPVHIRETTAFITSIEYGEEECANIFYNDGNVEKLPIETAKDFWQSSEMAIETIEHIELYVNSPLLEKGLVINDTPGVNTIIEKHVSLTRDIIELSDRILYVMGKPATNSDIDFINDIRNCNIEMMFVRTHIDEIKSSEENIEQSLKKEKEVLEPLTQEPVFFVSNDCNNEWFGQLIELRNFISTNLAQKIDAIINEHIRKRMTYIAERLLRVTSENINSIDIILSGENEKYIEHKQELEKKLSNMENILKKNKEGLIEKYNSICSDANSDLQVKADSLIKSVNSKIDNMEFGTNPEKYMSPVQAIIKSACHKLHRNYVEQFDNLLKTNSNELMEKLDGDGNFANINVSLPDSIQESNDNVNNIAEKIEALRVMKEGLDIELQEINEERRKTQNDIAELTDEENILKETLNSIQSELDSMPPYEPRYIEQEGSNKFENSFKTVGKIIDFGLLFVPGPSWAKLGTKVVNGAAKGAKALKMGKTAASLTKAATTISKAGKAAKAADTTIDVMKFANRISDAKNKRNKVENVAPGLLDYLSVDFYLGKLGKKFDKPTTKYIDKEYEREYNQAEANIKNKKRKEAEERIRLNLEIMQKQSDIEKSRKEEEIRKRKQEEADAEIAKLKIKLEKEKYSSKISVIKNSYKEQAKITINDYVQRILTTVSAEVERGIKGYIDSYDFRIVADIKRVRKDMDNLEAECRNADRRELETKRNALVEAETFLKSIN